MKHKLLWIIRHGHAADSLDIPDFERPLTEKGQERALRIGRCIHSASGTPEFILTSSAPRAAATAKLLARERDTVVEERAQLYMASVKELVAAARAIPCDIRSVAIVGHNPGITRLANLLADQKKYQLPPLGAVCFCTTHPWEDIGLSPLRVLRFISPNEDSA